MKNPVGAAVTVRRALAVALALLALACAAACSSPTSEAGRETTSGRRGSAAADPSLCPRSCFLSEGRCVGLPADLPEADARSDQLPVITPEPCDPRCCEGS